MAAHTTIHDLPDDMLHEIFGHVYAAEPKLYDELIAFATAPPVGAHRTLRSVCRRWRDIADWVSLSMSQIFVDADSLDDAGAARVRHPGAVKKLLLINMPTSTHSTSLSRVAASMFNSADLRRALVDLRLELCCLPALVPGVAPVASCTALTKLELSWHAHPKERVVPANVLSPLSALRMLNTLGLGHSPIGGPLPKSAQLAPLPALPDVPSLTCLNLGMSGNFVPVGSDAALGRLRMLILKHNAPTQALFDAEDPFLLRAAFDAGTWQPSRLTGLKELAVALGSVRDSRAPSRPPRTGSRAGSEWAPLAGQVTALTMLVEAGGRQRLSTGIVAGLGALTALRELHVVRGSGSGSAPSSARSGVLEPVSYDHVQAPHLTLLEASCMTTAVSVSRFPKLASLRLESATSQPPLNLRSLVQRSTLKSLMLAVEKCPAPGAINVAELFVGGAGWPVLEYIGLKHAVLEWDTTGLPGAPTAAEFEQRVRQLLPALVNMGISAPYGRDALHDRSRVGYVVAFRRHVLPALMRVLGWD